MDRKRRNNPIDDSDEHEYDGATSQQSRPTRIQRIEAIPMHDTSVREEEDILDVEDSTQGGYMRDNTRGAYVSRNLGVQYANANANDCDHQANARVSQAGAKAAVQRPGTQTRRDNINGQTLSDGPSWGDSSPAPFEANELHRAGKYKRENSRLNKVHDGALVRSLCERMPLLKNWEDSRIARPRKQRLPTNRETPQAPADAKNPRIELSLEGQGRKSSLSPVLPIRPSTRDRGIDALKLDEGGLWPIGKFVAFVS